MDCKKIESARVLWRRRDETLAIIEAEEGVTGNAIDAALFRHAGKKP